jgi:hypothetical protein
MSRLVNSIVRPKDNNQQSRVYFEPGYSLFENVVISGGPESTAALTQRPSKNPAATHLEDFQFEGFRNTDSTVIVNKAPFRGTRLRMDGGQTGIKLTGGALADIRDTVIKNHQRAGIRAENADILFDNLTLSNNEVGIDLGEGTRGDIINSKFDGNWSFDIRVHQDVLIGIFDTTARKIYNVPYSYYDLEQVDAEWISSQILNTTNIYRKAKGIVKLRNKVGKKIVETGVWELAKLIILG